MPAYFTNELTLNLPPELKDKTHHIFALSDDGPSAFNLVIARNPVPADMTTGAYASQLLREMEKALPRFSLENRVEILVNKQPALKLEYKWVNQGTRMYQTLISMFLGEGADRKVLQVTGTVSDEQNQKWNDVFEDIVASIRLRSPDGEYPRSDA